MLSPNPNQPSVENVRAWNDEMVQLYNPEEYHARTIWLIRMIEKRRVNAVVQAFRSGEHRAVLEVGCGAGNILERVDVPYRFGIDLSYFMAHRTRRRLHEFGLQAGTANADASQLPFPDQSFDGVICTEVIEHVLDPRTVVQEIWRVSKPKATVMISVPNEHLIDRAKRLIDKVGLRRIVQRGYNVPMEDTNEWHLHVFDLPAIQSILEHKFNIKRVLCIPFFWLPLRYVIQCTPR